MGYPGEGRGKRILELVPGSLDVKDVGLSKYSKGREGQGSKGLALRGRVIQRDGWLGSNGGSRGPDH